MPITTTVRLVNPATAADLNFCVAAATAAGLQWDTNTARAYATDPNYDLAILLGSWPERGINSNVRLALIQNRRSAGSGGRARTWLVAIDPSRIPDELNNQGGRIKVVDRLLNFCLDRAIARGTAKVDVGPIVNGGRVHAYLSTLPNDSKVEGATHTDYIFDVATLKATLTAPARSNLYGGA